MTVFLGEIPLERESDVLRAALDVLRARLPQSWRLETDSEPTDPRVDAALRLWAPDGSEIAVLVEAKRILNTRDVPMALEQLERAAGDGDRQAGSLLVARYLAPETRARIMEAGAGYVDATGNVYLANERPALLLRDRGADRDPWRGPGRPRGSLKGPPAARVVRALIDFAPPYTVPEVTKLAGASTGATYRVIKFLEELGLVEREPKGSIVQVGWRAIIERWSRDYGFVQSNTVGTFLEPRGLSALTDRLADEPGLEYALTGSLAVQQVAPYAPARLAMLYVSDLVQAATELNLRETATGANVVLAAGDYGVVFERTRLEGGLRVAALSQVAVDLLSGPGRNPSEATALMNWMERNESEWRR